MKNDKLVFKHTVMLGNERFLNQIFNIFLRLPGTESFKSGSGIVSFLPGSVSKFGLDPDSDP